MRLIIPPYILLHILRVTSIDHCRIRKRGRLSIPNTSRILLVPLVIVPIVGRILVVHRLPGVKLLKVQYLLLVFGQRVIELF
jgi:hypothetical protein